MKKWSRKYDRCIICGTTEVKHHSKGMCIPCYRKQHGRRYYEENKEARKQYGKQWYAENKEHSKQYGRQYREDNKQQVRQNKKQYYQKNKEHIKQRTKQYYRENKEYCKQRSKQWGEENKESYSQYQKQWYKENKERLMEYSKQYYQENPEKVKQRQKRYYENNREKILQKNNRWYADNPEKAIAKSTRRRSRKLNAGGDHTGQDRKFLKRLCNYNCMAGCDKAINKRNPLSVDHVIPLSKGGRNDIFNLQVLCKSCNSSKHNSRNTDYRRPKFKRAVSRYAYRNVAAYENYPLQLESGQRALA